MSNSVGGGRGRGYQFWGVIASVWHWLVKNRHFATIGTIASIGGVLWPLLSSAPSTSTVAVAKLEHYAEQQPEQSQSKLAEGSSLRPSVNSTRGEVRSTTGASPLVWPATGSMWVRGAGGTTYHMEITVHNTTPVLATGDGVVEDISSCPFTFDCSDGFEIRHGAMRTVYGNIDQILVKKGQLVKIGQVVGWIITNGQRPSHLDFMLLRGDEVLDPDGYMPPFKGVMAGGDG